MFASVVTVTAAVPFFVSSATETAVTVKVAAVSSDATVRSPDSLILVSSLSAPATLHNTVVSASVSAATVALNCLCVPFCTFGAVGSTVTEFIFGCITGTSTLTVLVLSNVEEALTTTFSAVSSAPIFSSPVLVMVVFTSWFPSTVHVTVPREPSPVQLSSAVTVPVNCCVCSRFNPLTVPGVTVTSVTAGRSAKTFSIFHLLSAFSLPASQVHMIAAPSKLLFTNARYSF